MRNACYSIYLDITQVLVALSQKLRHRRFMDLLSHLPRHSVLPLSH